MALVRNVGGGLGQDTLDQSAQRIEVPIVASGAVAVGDVLVWDGQTTDDHPTVHKADVSADDPALIAGVALEAAAAAGDVILVVRSGPCKVNIDDATVAAAELAGFHATADGAADGTAADATTVAGDSFGVFLGAEIGTTNQAVVDVRLGT